MKVLKKKYNIVLNSKKLKLAFNEIFEIQIEKNIFEFEDKDIKKV